MPFYSWDIFKSNPTHVTYVFLDFWCMKSICETFYRMEPWVWPPFAECFVHSVHVRKNITLCTKAERTCRAHFRSTLSFDMRFGIYCIHFCNNHVDVSWLLVHCGCVTDMTNKKQCFPGCSKGWTNLYHSNNGRKYGSKPLTQDVERHCNEVIAGWLDLPNGIFETRNFWVPRTIYDDKTLKCAQWGP